MHVNADAAAIDLARSELDKADRLRRHAALFRCSVQGVQGLHGVRNDHRWVLHSCLHDCFPPWSTRMTDCDQGIVTDARARRLAEHQMTPCRSAGLPEFFHAGRISRAALFAIAGSPVAAPSLRLAGRRDHDAMPIPRITSGTITFKIGSPTAACENAAPVRSNAMPA